MSHLQEFFAPYWRSMQTSLFPWLEEELGPLTETQQQLVQTLEIIRVEQHLPQNSRVPGRPLKDRAAIARAFVAKSVYNMPTTRMLLDRLATDVALRRLCGWEQKRRVPSEAVFSRAFADFATTRLPERVHEALIRAAYQEQLVGHISRDATAIEAREKPHQKAKAAKEESPPQRQRGRPRKDPAPVEKNPTRLERQLSMTLPEMLGELPRVCNVGTKRNSQGHQESWIGYKLHLDVVDGDIPITSLLTSASLHDSQVAIPLATLSAKRVVNLYDLMDAAYDAPPILEHSMALGHVPIIDVNPRRNALLKAELAAEAKRLNLLHLKTAEAVRYNQRSASERVNARLKDEFGARYVRVRGNAKVMCHLMFGILALTADQLMRFVT